MEKCINHPTKEALSFCHACEEFFCRECLTDGENYFFCRKVECQNAKLHEKDSKNEEIATTKPQQLVDDLENNDPNIRIEADG